MVKEAAVFCTNMRPQIFIEAAPDGFEARQAVTVLGSYNMPVSELEKIQYNPFNQAFSDNFVSGKGATKEAAVEALRVAAKQMAEMSEASMRAGVHEYTGEYCPWCYRPMLRVIETGHQFCENSSPSCEYEVTEGGEKPVSKALYNELTEINQAHKRERMLLTQKYDQLRADAVFRHTGNSNEHFNMQAATWRLVVD